MQSVRRAPGAPAGSSPPVGLLERVEERRADPEYADLSGRVR